MRTDSRRIVIKKGSADRGSDAAWETETLPFLHLTLDLPPTPLYADSLEKNIIPQARPPTPIPDCASPTPPPPYFPAFSRASALEEGGEGGEGGGAGGIDP